MKLVVSTKAQREIRDATAWYEEQTRGLSAEFLRAVELNLGYVQRSPLLFAETLPGVRRIGLRRFPYSLFLSHTRRKNHCPGLPASAPRPAGLATQLNDES